jgi:oxygen-independent coproporphyrinogen-3 oxidase
MHVLPSGARQSLYPGADRFNVDFGYRDYLQAVAGLRTRASARPLALYLHIPFCDKAATRNGGKAAVYLSYLKREIEMQGRLFVAMNQVEQLHIGGCPVYLSDAQMEELMRQLRRCFQFAPDEVGEYAIGVDPRCVSGARILSLRRLGFNHLGVRMRDDDAPLRVIIDAAREAKFRAVSVDLDEPLPRILAKVIEAAPDRITVARHAEQCIDALGAAGYVYIGMDQFARAGDELAVAQVQGRLHRNAHGYSVHADLDQVSCGVAAIGAVGATCSQNVKTLDAYYELIDRNELPIGRGVRVTMDDALRRTIIQMLMCQFELSIPCIEQAFPIVFADYFAPELARLDALARDGLVTLEPEWLSVTAKGRIRIRDVCTVFG